jgi:hypothetical protein
MGQSNDLKKEQADESPHPLASFFIVQIRSDYRLIANPKVNPGITSSWSFRFGF